MKTVGRVFDVVEVIIKNMCGALVLGFTGITLVGIIARYLIGSPIWWCEQACRYLFIWMLMLYFPIIVRHEQNLGFDIIVKRLPKKLQDISWLVCNLLICGFGVFYLKYTLDLCAKFDRMHKMMEGIHVPASFMYAAQAVGAILLIAFSLEVIINLFGKIVHDTKDGDAI